MFTNARIVQMIRKLDTEISLEEDSPQKLADELIGYNLLNKVIHIGDLQNEKLNLFNLNLLNLFNLHFFNL